MATAAAASFSPSATPGASQRAGMLVSSDRSFALHGEIMLLILVVLFIFFLISIVFVLCMKRPFNAVKLSQFELVEPENSPFPAFDGRICTGLKPVHQLV